MKTEKGKQAFQHIRAKVDTVPDHIKRAPFFEVFEEKKTKMMTIMKKNSILHV